MPLATAMIAPTPGMPCGAGGDSGRGWASRPRGLGRRRLVRREHRGHRQHAGQRRDRVLAGLAQRRGAGAASRIDLDREADMAVAQHQALDDVLLHHAAAADRIDDLVERLQHRVASRMGHVCPLNVPFAASISRCGRAVCAPAALHI
ncbi:MAG: hypothetical protein WDM81_10255 [Rhizomicrobium sp.]